MKVVVKLLTISFMLLLNQKVQSSAICRQRPLDVIFLLDGSRSVRPQNFDIVKNYVIEFVDTFDSLGPSHSQIGVVQFASQVREEIQLNEFGDKEELKRAIDGIQYMEMGTMTGEALKFLVNTALQPSHGSRLQEGIHTFAVIITDGKSQDYVRGTVTRWQREAKNRGVEIFAIGIGRKTKQSELMELASIPKQQHVFKVESFKGIARLDVKILENEEICDEDECASNTNLCDHICINAEGTYKCDCQDGYILHEDQRSCYLPVPAPIPESLKFLHVAHTSAEAQWDIGDVSDDVIDHYVLIKSRIDGTEEEEVMTIYGNRSATLLGLEPQTEYRVSVSSTTEDDFSSPAEGFFSTLRVGQIRVSITNATLTTLGAIWTAADGEDLARYEVVFGEYRVGENGAGEIVTSTVVTKVFEPSVLQTRFTSLQPNTSYYVRVTPQYRTVEGGADTGMGKTDELIPPFVKVENTTLSTLKASWNQKGDYLVTSWSIAIYSGKEQEPEQEIEVEGSTNETTFHELKLFQQYTVEVKGQVLEDGQPFTTPKGKASKRTKWLKKPKVTLANVTATQLTALWDELNIVANNWSVKLYPKGKPNLFQAKETGRGQYSMRFIDLLPATLYKVEVVGHALEDGRIFKSQNGRNKIKTRPMLAPVVKASNATFSSLTASWREINVRVDLWVIQAFQEESIEPLQLYKVDWAQHLQVFNDLIPDTRYRFEVFGRISKDTLVADSPVGNASGITKSELFLDAPPIFCEDEVDTSALNLEWPETDEAVNEWVIVISPEDSENDLKTYKVPGSLNSRQINTLLPGTTYIVEVFGQVLEGETSINTQSGFTTCATEPLSSPLVRLVGKTFSSLIVGWENINMPVSSWRINLLSEDLVDIQVIEAEEYKNVHVFHGLQEGTHYEVQVIGQVTIDNVTLGSPIGAISATTKSLMNVPGPKIECLESNLTSIHVLWSDASSEVATWTIHYFPEGRQELRQTMKQPIVFQEIMDRVISNLEHSTSYIVEIFGSVVEGQLTFNTQSGITVCSTDSLTVPQVEVTNVTFFSLTVHWRNIETEVDAWRVLLRNQEEQLVEETVTTKTMNEFIGLEQRTRYNIIVVGIVMAENVTSRPGVAEATTDELNSPYVECMEETATSATVSWYDVGIELSYCTVEARNTETGEKTEATSTARRNDQIQLRSLVPETGYIIQLRCIVKKNGKKYSTPTEYTFCVTESLEMPEVSVTKISTSNLHVQWSDINARVQSWTITSIGQHHKEVGWLKANWRNRKLVLIYNITVSGSENDFIFENLIPQTEYWIEVTGYLNGKSSPPGSTVGRTGNLPSPSVSTTHPALSTLNAEWTGVGINVTNWIATIRQVGNQENLNIANVPGSENSVLFGNLQPNTDYEVSVIGEIRASSERAIHSLPGLTRGTTEPIPPHNITITHRGETTLVATFHPSQYPADNYEAACIVTDSEKNLLSVTNIEVCLSNFTVECRNLDPATKYVIKIKTLYRDLASELISISGMTLTPSPSGLTLIDRTTQSLTVEWQAPTAKEVANYFVVYRVTEDSRTIKGKYLHKDEDKGSDTSEEINESKDKSDNGTLDDVFTVKIVNGSQTSLVLVGLEPNQSYLVQVRAEINGQQSSAEEAVETTLSEFIQLQIDDVGFSSINVSWNSSSVTHLQSYSVEYKVVSEEEESELIISKNASSYILSNLHTATAYKVSIKANYLRSHSESSPVFATTLALPPVGPLTFTNITRSSFLVHWLPPAGNPQPNSYTVTYYTERGEIAVRKNVTSTQILLDEIAPSTLYDVMVSAVYNHDLTSHPIRGKETTLSTEGSTCYCSASIKTQEQMQKMLIQMMQQIDILNEKINLLTAIRRRSRRSKRKRQA